MKTKTIYRCTECGVTTPKWMGQCHICKAWNSIVEEKESKPHKQKIDWIEGNSKIVSLTDIALTDSKPRTSSGINELDRVLGGGIVKGSVILVAGDPGIGKSTLLLQAAGKVCRHGKVLYVAGEESPAQIKLRADRLEISSDNLLIYPETNVERVLETGAGEKPALIIVDSIQTIYSSDSDSLGGTVSQVRNVTSKMLQFAKKTATSIIIIGHVTKDGNIAGPKLLEHMVDTVLYFEGDQSLTYKLLRTTKNRFGSTNEIGIFEMGEKGLVEISNPSEFFLEERPDRIAGSVVTSCMEGTRPILVELQALVTQTRFGIPKRGALGVDLNRLSIILAVMEKRAGLQLMECDLFVNVVGGIKITEPSVDLALVMAIGSSFKNKAVEQGVVAFGEVGLGGEVRAIGQADQRVNEASRLYFKKCILPKKNAEKMKKKFKNMDIIGIHHIGEALKYV